MSSDRKMKSSVAGSIFSSEKFLADRARQEYRTQPAHIPFHEVAPVHGCSRVIRSGRSGRSGRSSNFSLSAVALNTARDGLAP